jgi:hypothetical protein
MLFNTMTTQKIFLNQSTTAWTLPLAAMIFGFFTTLAANAGGPCSTASSFFKVNAGVGKVYENSISSTLDYAEDVCTGVEIAGEATEVAEAGGTVAEMAVAGTGAAATVLVPVAVTTVAFGYVAKQGDPKVIGQALCNVNPELCPPPAPTVDLNTAQVTSTAYNSNGTAVQQYTSNAPGSVVGSGSATYNMTPTLTATVNGATVPVVPYTQNATGGGYLSSGYFIGKDACQSLSSGGCVMTSGPYTGQTISIPTVPPQAPQQKIVDDPNFGGAVAVNSCPSPEQVPCTDTLATQDATLDETIPEQEVPTLTLAGTPVQGDGSTGTGSTNSGSLSGNTNSQGSDSSSSTTDPGATPAGGTQVATTTPTATPTGDATPAAQAGTEANNDPGSASRKLAGEPSCDPTYALIDPEFQCTQALTTLSKGKYEMQASSQAADKVQTGVGTDAVSTAQTGQSQVASLQAAQQATTSAQNKSLAQAALQAGFAKQYEYYATNASEAADRLYAATQPETYKVVVTSAGTATIELTDPSVCGAGSCSMSTLLQVPGYTVAGMTSVQAHTVVDAAVKLAGQMLQTEKLVADKAATDAKNTNQAAVKTEASGLAATTSIGRDVLQIAQYGQEGLGASSSLTSALQTAGTTALGSTAIGREALQAQQYGQEGMGVAGQGQP